MTQSEVDCLASLAEDTGLFISCSFPGGVRDLRIKETYYYLIIKRTGVLWFDDFKGQFYCSFENFLDNINPETQERLLFHLDIFSRGEFNASR